MTRRPVPVAVQDVRVGDRLFAGGVQLEVHRIVVRPGAGIALVAVQPDQPWVGRRLFYKLGEQVEVLQ